MPGCPCCSMIGNSVIASWCVTISIYHHAGIYLVYHPNDPLQTCRMPSTIIVKTEYLILFSFSHRCCTPGLPNHVGESWCSRLQLQMSLDCTLLAHLVKLKILLRAAIVSRILTEVTSGSSPVSFIGTASTTIKISHCWREL